MTYYQRLTLWRVIYLGILAFVWLWVISTMGFAPGWKDLTGLLLIFAVLGYPRNAAKRAAKRALRQRSLNAAVAEEIRRQRRL